MVLDSKPAPPQVTAPTPPPAPPSRFAGGWSYPTNGHFYGAEPEFVELAIREDNGHLMGGLSLRFKPGSAALAKKFLSGADPFVIAHAMENKGTIVTHETLANAGSNVVKIPNVCEYFSVKWSRAYDALESPGLQL